MKNLIILLMFILTGCATLHEDVLHSLKEGDSKTALISLLGSPNTFKSIVVKDFLVTEFVYIKHADTCTFALYNDRIISISCVEDSTYISSGARALKGFSEGFNKGQQ